jgi:hypothetical protein
LGDEVSGSSNFTIFFQVDGVSSGEEIDSTFGDGNRTGGYCCVFSLILKGIGMRDTGEASTTGLSGTALAFFAGLFNWTFHILSTSDNVSLCAAFASGVGDSVTLVSPIRSVVAARGLDPFDLRPAMRSPISKEAPLAALVGVCPVAFRDGRGDLVGCGAAGTTLSSIIVSPFVTTFAPAGAVAGGMAAPCISMKARSKAPKGTSLTLLASFGGLMVVALWIGVREREFAIADIFGSPFFVALGAGTAGASFSASPGILPFTGNPRSTFESVCLSGLLRFDGVCFTGLAPRDVVSFLALPVFVGLGVLLIGVMVPESAFFGVTLLIGSSHEK